MSTILGRASLLREQGEGDWNEHVLKGCRSFLFLNLGDALLRGDFNLVGLVISQTISESIRAHVLRRNLCCRDFVINDDLLDLSCLL